MFFSKLDSHVYGFHHQGGLYYIYSTSEWVLSRHVHPLCGIIKGQLHQFHTLKSIHGSWGALLFKSNNVKQVVALWEMQAAVLVLFIYLLTVQNESNSVLEECNIRLEDCYSKPDNYVTHNATTVEATYQIACSFLWF